MILRTALAVSVLLPASFGVMALSNGTTATAAAATLQEEEHVGNPVLEVFMKDLGRSLRGLGRGLREEGAMAAGLAEVVRLEKALVEVKEELPVTVTDVTDEKERRRAALEWREDMHELLRGLLDLEMAYAREDADAVMAQLRALDELKKKGHERFKP